MKRKTNNAPKYNINDEVYLENATALAANPYAVYVNPYKIINIWQDPSGIQFYRLNDGYFYPEIYIRKTLPTLVKGTDKNILKGLHYEMHIPSLKYKEHYREEDNVLTCKNADLPFEIIINMDPFYYNNKQGVSCRTKQNTWYALVEIGSQNTKPFKSFYEAYAYANKTYIDYVEKEYKKHKNYNDFFNILLNNKHSKLKEIPNMFDYLPNMFDYLGDDNA